MSRIQDGSTETRGDKVQRSLDCIIRETQGGKTQGDTCDKK